jgi:spore germination protein KA
MWQKLKNWFKGIDRTEKEPQSSNQVFFNNLDKNKELLATEFDNIVDIKFRDIELTDGSNHNIKATLVYITNLIDKQIINDNILKPLLSKQEKDNLGKLAEEKDLESISNKIIDAESIEQISKVRKAVDQILAGNSLLLVDNTPYALSVATGGWEERSVSEPMVERTIRGPNMGFIENIEVNTGMIRRYIKSNQLKIESFTKGEYTQTKINLMYIEGIVNSKIVKEVKKRLASIEVGQINGGRHVLELIEDNSLSPFDTIYETERPDVTAAGVLEGRVAILIDGYPISLIAPMLFMENLISPEDYYSGFYYTSFFRLIRFLGLLVSSMLPGIYISILAFHQEVLPITLVNTVYAAREGVPFPIAIEMMIFGVFFEGIREGGARIPKALGSSITIVGALILGEAAISAGLLSPDSVIIGSLTGISIFLIPTTEFNSALLILRVIYTFAAVISGFYGMTITSLLIVAHLVSLRSFGVPYMRPIAPLQLADLKDFFIRVPYLLMNTRPKSLENENIVRQDNQPSKRFFFKYRINENDN